MIHFCRRIALIFLITGLAAQAAILEAGFISLDARARGMKQGAAALTPILDGAILRKTGGLAQHLLSSMNIFRPPRLG